MFALAGEVGHVTFIVALKKPPCPISTPVVTPVDASQLTMDRSRRGMTTVMGAGVVMDDAMSACEPPAGSARTEMTRESRGRAGRRSYVMTGRGWAFVSARSVLLVLLRTPRAELTAP